MWVVVLHCTQHLAHCTLHSHIALCTLYRTMHLAHNLAPWSLHLAQLHLAQLHIVLHKASCRDPNEIGASRFGSAVFEGRSDLFFLAKSDSKTRRRLNWTSQMSQNLCKNFIWDNQGAQSRFLWWLRCFVKLASHPITNYQGLTTNGGRPIYNNHAPFLVPQVDEF